MSSAKYPAQVSRSPRLKASAASRTAFMFSSDIAPAVSLDGVLLSMQSSTVGGSRPRSPACVKQERRLAGVPTGLPNTRAVVARDESGPRYFSRKGPDIRNVSTSGEDRFAPLPRRTSLASNAGDAGKAARPRSARQPRRAGGAALRRAAPALARAF